MKEYKWQDIPGSIFKEEWDLLIEIIKKYNIKTVLEFGSGQTTKLFHDLKLNYLSLEENKKLIKGYNIQHWDKKLLIFHKLTFKDYKLVDDKIAKLDMSFIDGPTGSENREISFIIAKDISEFIIVHDATNEWNTKWQRLYLKGKFELIDFIKTLFVWRRK